MSEEGLGVCSVKGGLGPEQSVGVPSAEEGKGATQKSSPHQ